MKRKALFFDVDGTLLNEITRTVPKSAVRALSKARENGHLVLINSGRTYYFLDEIRSQVEADGYLCGCGTYGILEGKVFYSHRIPRERGNEIKNLIVTCGLDGILEAYDGCYMQKGPSRFPGFRQMKERLPHVIRDDRWEDDDLEFDKFCVMSDEISDEKRFFEALKPDFQVIDRGDRFYECVPVGHSKAAIMDMVLKHYGLTAKDAYAFGDSMNDEAMLQFAGHGILMERHDKGLEPYGDFITRNVEDDGIQYALEHFGLI